MALAALVPALAAPVRAVAGDITLANFHYVNEDDTFLGVKTSFFPMGRFGQEVSTVHVEAIAITVGETGTTQRRLDEWTVDVGPEHVVESGEMGFFNPPWRMVQLDLTPLQIEPFGTPFVVVKVTFSDEELLRERLFPNIKPTGSTDPNSASMVDMGDGQLRAGLTFEELATLVPGSAVSGGCSQNSTTRFIEALMPLDQPPPGGGTHVMVHAIPRMMPP